MRPNRGALCGVKMTPEQVTQARKDRVYPIAVYYQSEIIGTMTQRREIEFIDYRHTDSILKGINEHKLGIFEYDSLGNFTKDYVEIRIIPET